MKLSTTHTQRGARGPGALLLAAVLALSIHGAGAQFTADDFNRPNDNTVGNGWSEYQTSTPTSIVISSQQLVMKGTTSGVDRVSRLSPGPYAPVLSSNACELSWSFNMRQTRPDPSGLNMGGYGLAVVLGGSHADPTQGTGYAVVLGSPGTSVDPLRLVKYQNGLVSNINMTTLIAYGDYGTEFLDVKVTFDPQSGLWKLYSAASLAGPFGNASTTTNLAGSATDNTYTGSSLPYIGCLWNHGTSAAEYGQFDNLKVPYECSSRAEFQSTSASIGGSGGSISIPVNLANPSGLTQVEVVLVSGNTERIGNFSSGTLEFSGSGTTEFLVLPIMEEGGCVGDEQIVLALQSISGGQGIPFIGPQNSFTLTITDEEVSTAVLLDENFETDGSGTRYTLNAPHASPSPGISFLRSNAAGFLAAGGFNATTSNGTYYIGGENMGSIMPNAEAIVTFNTIDIAGASSIDIEMLAGTRYAAVFDRNPAQNDYMLIETRVDGGGWVLAGAFRPNGPAGSLDKRMAVDTNLDGQGDGLVMSWTMVDYTFPVAVNGLSMDLRIRMRSTGNFEELGFDHVRVNATRCRPVYYANASGSTSDPIWSTQRSGEVSAITLGTNVSLVIQDGFVVTAGSEELVVRNLTVEPGGKLDLGTATVEIHGDELRNDASFTSNGELRLVGGDVITVTGDIAYELKDVTIDAPAGVMMPGTWNIKGTLQLDGGDLNTTDGTLTLRSSASATGRLGPVAPGASYTGELGMERYIPGGATNWRLIGSPVAGETVHDWKDDFFTAGFPGSHAPGFQSGGQPWPSIRWYNETNTGATENDGLLGVSGTTQPLMAGQGFAAWSGDNLTHTAPFLLDLRGTPNIAQTPIALPMTWTNTGHPTVDGYNLVSNPLPSAINFEAISLGADVDHGYSILNPANGNMATWNGSIGTNGANGIIQSSQGFWLKAHGPAVTTTVAESAKVPDNDGGVFGGKSDHSLVRLRINSAINTFSDETILAFDFGSPAFNSDDVPKFVFAHPAAPQIATQGEAGQWIAINAYGPYATNITIPVIVNVAVTGNYTITATEIENIGLSCLTLEDLETGIITSLSADAGYTFTMDAADDPNFPRFLFHGSAPLVVQLQDVLCAGQANGEARVEFTNGTADVTWSTEQGAVIDQQTIVAPGTALVQGLAAGNYSLSVAASSGCAAMQHLFSITMPEAISVQANVTDASCPETMDGEVIMQVVGGHAPYTYLWSNGSTGAGVVAQSGEYTVIVNDSLGCTEQAGPYVIGASEGALAMAAASMDPAPMNVPILFTSAGSVGDAFFWDFSDGATSTDADPEHSFTMPGTYTVMLHVTSGACSADTVITVVVETTTGITTVGSSHANAWFTDGSVNIDLAFDNGAPVFIEVLNAAGQLHAQHRAAGTPGRISLSTDGMTAGLWFIRITNLDEQRTFALPMID